VPFKWSWDSQSYITIDSQGSEFSKTCILIENKKKSQVWKSTDGSNTVHELVLKNKKINPNQKPCLPSDVPGFFNP
jgi:hypothetical protein